MNYYVLPRVPFSKIENGTKSVLNTSLCEYVGELKDRKNTTLFKKMIDFLGVFPLKSGPVSAYSDLPEFANALKAAHGEENVIMVASPNEATVAMHNLCTYNASTPHAEGSCAYFFIPQDPLLNPELAAALYAVCGSYENVKLYYQQNSNEFMVHAKNHINPMYPETTVPSIPLFFKTRLTEAFVVLAQHTLKRVSLQPTTLHEIT